MRSTFKLLKTKEIIAILDGDTNFHEHEFKDGSSIAISMPYLSGPDLCDLSRKFGLPVEYSWSGGALSRWQYLDNLLGHCIEHNTISDFFAYLFSIERFYPIIGNKRSACEIEDAYQNIINTIIAKINGCLYFGGHELVFIGNNFYVRRVNSKFEIEAPKIKIIDYDYINDISSRATRDIERKRQTSWSELCFLKQAGVS